MGACCPFPFQLPSPGSKGRKAKRCCACCGNFLFLWAYIHILWYMRMYTVWDWTYEWETRCAFPPLPVNQSGVKILVAGFAKTGTWAMTKHLHSIYKNTYHSQEFISHIWHPLSVEYWARPENGGKRPRVLYPLLFRAIAEEEFRETGVRPPEPDVFRVNLSGVVTSVEYKDRWPRDDLEVFENLPREKLAEAVSRCKVDLIAFDGIETLFWDMYEISPGAKVISLDWRTFDSWRRSLENFSPKWFMTQLISSTFVYNSLHGLPYGFVIKKVDQLAGGRIDEMLRNGEAWLQPKYDASLMLWCVLTYPRWVFSHWWGGLMKVQATEEEYNSFHAEVRRRVPEQNLLRWDFKKNTWEELCKFLEVKDCPHSGFMTHAPNQFAWDKPLWDETEEPMMLLPLFIFCHWLNWRVFMAIVGVPLGLLRMICCREKAKSKAA